MVFCIDATGSMGGVIDMVKRNAVSFYGDVVDAMQKKGKTIDKLRLRMVVFRDYVADGENAMLETDSLICLKRLLILKNVLTE